MLKLPNFTKKAASKWILVSDVALKILSNAQPLRSLIQYNVVPIPGRPTVKTFLLSTLRRSSGFSVVSFRRVTLDKLCKSDRESNF